MQHTSLFTFHFALFALFLFIPVQAQEYSTGYEFLKVPVAVKSAALGGNAVSVADDDPTLMFVNPAVINYVTDNTVNFDYTSYISGSNKFGASFIKQTGERGTIGFGAQLLDYGKMKETTADMKILGEYSANDIDIQGGYTYMLDERWSGGVQGKVLLSKYGEFSSVALGVDLGLHYNDEGRGWMLGLVGQNLGGQVDPLYQTNEALPFTLAFGVSKQLANAPLRLTFTLPDITHWQNSFFHNLSMGCDITLSKSLWIAIGYNPLRSKEMRTGTDDKSHGAGLSLGGGLTIKKFKLGVAWGKYHVAASSVIINVSYGFN